MQFKVISEEQWRRVFHSKADIDIALEKVRRLVQSLTSCFEQAQVGMTVLAERDGDGDCVARINALEGKGRLCIEWVDTLESRLTPFLRLDREREDAYGKTFWEPVWGFNISEYGNPYVGSGEGKRVFALNRSFGGNEVFSLGMSMQYAIAVGPQVES